MLAGDGEDHRQLALSLPKANLDRLFLHGPTEIASRGRLKSPPEAGVFATPKRVAAADTEVIRLSSTLFVSEGEMPRPRSEMRRVREVLRIHAELGANVGRVKYLSHFDSVAFRVRLSGLHDQGNHGCINDDRSGSHRDRDDG